MFLIPAWGIFCCTQKYFLTCSVVPLHVNLADLDNPLLKVIKNYTHIV